ncbi:MAG: DUF934 domain-containing protein [Sandaracinaceae bacterium]
MTLILRDDAGARRAVDDPWTRLEEDAPRSDGDVIVSWARWTAGLEPGPGRVGVVVPGGVDPAEVATKLDGVALIAIEFPKFTDGRGYSLARLLRDRYGYTGELRAVGHVLRDQLHYMARCGIDSFDLFDGKDVEDAIQAFSDFHGSYQPAADGNMPAWKRPR